MTNHDNNNQSLNPNFELSKEEFELLHNALAVALVKYGEVSDLVGEYPSIPNGFTPKLFSIDLPGEFIREVFFKNDDSVVVTDENSVSYMTPHRIEDAEDQPTYEIVNLNIVTQLPNNVTCNQWLTLKSTDGRFEGYVDTEYSQEEKRISPTNLEEGNMLLDHDRVNDILDDAFALERSLMLDDAQKLREVGEFINQRGRTIEK